MVLMLLFFPELGFPRKARGEARGFGFAGRCARSFRVGFPPAPVARGLRHLLGGQKRTAGAGENRLPLFCVRWKGGRYFFGMPSDANLAMRSLPWLAGFTDLSMSRMMPLSSMMKVQRLATPRSGFSTPTVLA